MSVCFICLLLRVGPRQPEWRLNEPAPPAVCTEPQFVCPYPAEESQSKVTADGTAKNKNKKSLDAK
jgi:hypothetical protein